MLKWFDNQLIMYDFLGSKFFCLLLSKISMLYFYRKNDFIPSKSYDTPDNAANFLFYGYSLTFFLLEEPIAMTIFWSGLIICGYSIKFRLFKL